MIRLAARAAKPIHLARLRPLNAARFRDRKLPWPSPPSAIPGQVLRGSLEDGRCPGCATARLSGPPSLSPATRSRTCWPKAELLWSRSDHHLKGLCPAAGGPWPGAGPGPEKTAVLDIELAFGQPPCARRPIIDLAIAAFQTAPDRALKQAYPRFGRTPARCSAATDAWMSNIKAPAAPTLQYFELFDRDGFRRSPRTRHGCPA